MPVVDIKYPGFTIKGYVEETHKHVLCTYIQQNDVLSAVLVSPFRSISELNRCAFRNHLKSEKGLFRAVAIDTDDTPPEVDRWLRGYDDVPKPENSFDVLESVKYTVLHPNGSDGITMVLEPKE